MQILVKNMMRCQAAAVFPLYFTEPDQRVEQILS